MPLGVGEQTMYPDIGFLVKDQQNWMEVKYFKAGAGPTTANGGNFLKDMFRLAGFKQDTPEPICWFLHVYDGEPTSLFTDTELWQDRFLKNGRAEVGFTFEGLNRTTQTILKGLRWQGEKRFVIQNIRSEPTRRRVLVLTKLISFS